MSNDAAEAARTTLHRYARAVDTRDERALAEVLADDVVLERVDGARTGRAAVLAFYRGVFDGPTVWSKHLVTNVVTGTCTAPDGSGDAIAVTAYFQAVSRTPDEAIAIYGEYDDVFTPAPDGTLRIARKRIDVQQTFALEPTPAEPQPTEPRDV